MQRWTVMVIAATVLTGCWLSHEVGTHGGGDAMGHEGEPDVMPGERPSDTPHDDWGSPPSGTTGDCCTVGTPIGIDDTDMTAMPGPPLVAWNGSQWGVEYFAPLHGVVSFVTRFMALDASAHPLSAPRPLASLGAPAALAWGVGRYATTTGPHLHPQLALLDSTGTPIAQAETAERGAGIARFPAAHAWALVTSPSTGTADGTIPYSLRLYDDALAERGSGTLLGQTYFSAGQAIVSSKSVLTVLAATPDGIAVHTFADEDATPGASHVLWTTHTQTDSSCGTLPGQGLMAAALRDFVVAVSADSTDLESVVYDPFADRIVYGPASVAPSPVGNVAASGGAAGDDEGDTVGVCYMDGPPPYGGYVVHEPDGTCTGMNNADRIQFALLGPDGAPLGEPVLVANVQPGPHFCRVAVVSRDAYVVLFWGTPPGVVDHALYAARIDVRR